MHRVAAKFGVEAVDQQGDRLFCYRLNQRFLRGIRAIYASAREKQYVGYMFSGGPIDPKAANSSEWRAFRCDNEKGSTHMRLTPMLTAGLLAAGPVIAFGAPAYSQQQNDLMGQAQRFFNNNNNDQNNRDAYQRGREDELRHQQAERDRGYRRDYDQRSGDRDLSRESRYRSQDRDTYNYNRYP
jgi:hypothetical protein